MHCDDCHCERQANHDHETNDGNGWAVEPQTCWYCGHTQVSVYPADAAVGQFQCGGCGLMTAIRSDDRDEAVV